MDKMIAYCGITCTDCGAYIATQNDDDAKRKEVAEEWKKQFNHDVKPEDINCDGCPTRTGRIVSYCAVCEIRQCAQERDMVSCAYCDDYVCDKLEKFFQMAPMLRATLDEIRKGL